MTFDLISGGSSIYTDNAIINSVIQDIGGQSRVSSSYIDFNFDLPTNTLYPSWSNDALGVQAGATGVTYNIYGNPSTSIVNKYNNGLLIHGGLAPFTQNTTITPDASIPFEFNPGLGLILLDVGFGMKEFIKRQRFQKVNLELEEASVK